MDTFDTTNNTPYFYIKGAHIERDSDFQYKIALKEDYLGHQVLHLVQGVDLSEEIGLIPWLSLKSWSPNHAPEFWQANVQVFLKDKFVREETWQHAKGLLPVYVFLK